MKEHARSLNGRLPKEVNAFGKRRRIADSLAEATVDHFVLDILSIVWVCVCVCDVLQISTVFASLAACLSFTIDGLLWAFPAHIIGSAV